MNQKAEIELSPYWWEAAPLSETASDPVPPPSKADVVIVGAGFAGLTAALTLVRAGRQVIVVDAMRPGEGASSRNGGICSGNVKFSFGTLIDKMGIDGAKSLYGEGVLARNALAELIFEENIECDFDLVGRFDGANSPKAYEQLGRESDLLNKHLNLGVEVVPKSEQHKELGTDHYFGGRVRPDIGGVHPAKLHAGLLLRCRDGGVSVIPETTVTGINKDGSKFEVSTSRGPITAGNVIVATNGYTDDNLKWLRKRVISIPSQIIATEPLDPDVMARLMPKKRMLGDTRHLYNYYRPSPDGTRIIFGGRRGADTDDPVAKTAHLKNNLVEIFPELKDIGITHSWWGYTGYSFDFLPSLTEHDGVHYAVAFCGSGVVWAPWLGKKVALSILGEREAAKTYFDQRPLRGRPLYWGKPWFLPPIIGWLGLKDKYGL